MKPLLLASLKRAYYFAEAMAFYDAYYRPLIETFRPARDKLADPNRHEDRPLTWVPLVFHCTTFRCFEKIIDCGFVQPKRGYVSLTEIPIGELDRMKIRVRDPNQIAIAFPRRFIQSIGFASVLYLKHNPALKNLVNNLLTSIPELSPFVEPEDDLSAFQEIRTTSPIPVSEAVWLLSSQRDTKTRRPIVPGLESYTARCGRIQQSFWHRTHQVGVLDEWQYLSVKVDSNGIPTDYKFAGEFYARKEWPATNEYPVNLPDREHKIIFRSVERSSVPNYEGPMYFIDVARKLFDTLARCGEDPETLLEHRLIPKYE